MSDNFDDLENIHTISCDASTVCNTVISEGRSVCNTASTKQSEISSRGTRIDDRTSTITSNTETVCNTATSEKETINISASTCEQIDSSTQSESVAHPIKANKENEKNNNLPIVNSTHEQAQSYEKYVPKGIRNSNTACFVNVALHLLFINPYVQGVMDHILSDRQSYRSHDFPKKELLYEILDIYRRFDDENVQIHKERVELRKLLITLDSYDESILEGQEDTITLYMAFTAIIDEYTNHRFGYKKLEESEIVYHTPHWECTACGRKLDREIRSTEIYLSTIDNKDSRGNIKSHDPMGLDDLIDLYCGPQTSKEPCGSTICNHAQREIKTFTEFNLVRKRCKTYKFRINRIGPEAIFELLEKDGTFMIDASTGKRATVKERVKLKYHCGYPEIWQPVNQCFPKGLCLELYAVVYHVGEECKSGHYICDVKNWITKKWYTCDDQDVRELKHSSCVPQLKYWNRMKRGRNFNNNCSAEKSRKQRYVCGLFYFDQNSFNTF